MNATMQLDLIDRVLMLGRIDAFAQLTTEQLSLLGMLAEREDRALGEVIYEAGAPPAAMYLVAAGRVALEHDGALIAAVGPGQDFGTWALFDPEPRVTTARALVPAVLLKLDRERFEDLVEDHPDVAHGIFRALARRVRTLAGMIEGTSDERNSIDGRAT